MMRDHGVIGRHYAGGSPRSSRAPSASTTGSGASTSSPTIPSVFKKLIYEMRFDEASAWYAEFGPFYTGLQFPASELPALLEGRVPALGASGSGDTSAAAPSIVTLAPASVCAQLLGRRAEVQPEDFMTSTLRSHFADYAAFHRTAGNKVCHALGIPLIVLRSLALLAQVPLFTVAGFTVTAGRGLDRSSSRSTTSPST